MNKITFQIQDFPACLYQSKILDVVRTNNLSNTGSISSTNESFYINGLFIHECRYSTSAYAPDSRNAQIRLDIDTAKLLSSKGFKIKPVSNAFMMNEQERKEFRDLEYQFYKKN